MVFIPMGSEPDSLGSNPNSAFYKFGFWIGLIIITITIIQLNKLLYAKCLRQFPAFKKHSLYIYLLLFLLFFRTTEVKMKWKRCI